MIGVAHRKTNGRMAPPRRVDFTKPGWDCFYWLGVDAARALPVDKSWQEIGNAIGMTKQNTFSAGMVALGKIVFYMRQHVEKRD